MLFCESLHECRMASEHLRKIAATESTERKHWQHSFEKMLTAAFCWLKRDLEISPAVSFLVCEEKQGFVHNLKANRIVSKASDSASNYFSRQECLMGFRILASSSGQTDNIVTCSYLMEAVIAPWMLHFYTPVENLTKIRQQLPLDLKLSST